MALRFRPDGTFRILQITDTHEGPVADPRTAAFLAAALDDLRPDLVVHTGDAVASDRATAADLARALGHVVRPMEARAIPWLLALGNHDEDHTWRTGVDAPGVLELCRAHPCNVNAPGPEGLSGTGNMHALVLGSRSDAPAFNVWALDGGREAPKVLGGQALADGALPGWGWLPHWDWVKQDQVAWYAATSRALERAHGRKVPSLLFVHLPLHEHRAMWEDDAARRAARAAGEPGPPPPHGVTGERHEDECTGAFNSGLFAAALGRGDVLGVFCGHDHVNDYQGDHFGIRLGYAASAGFAPYGLGGEEDHRLRGARVFDLDERDPRRFTTRMVRASGYGVR
jgi:3',5'-cyclic AMP phosphodiesterase CpdA